MCDCKEPVAPDSALDFVTKGVAKRLVNYCSANGCDQRTALSRLEALSRAPLTRGTSRVLSTRVATDTAERISRVAALRGMSPSTYLRGAVAILTAPVADDPERKLSDLLLALGLPEGSSPDVVLAAVRDVIAALTPSETDPLAQAADPQPAPTAFTVNPVALTRDQQTAWLDGRAAQRAERVSPLGAIQAARRAAASRPR